MAWDNLHSTNTHSPGKCFIPPPSPRSVQQSALIQAAEVPSSLWKMQQQEAVAPAVPAGTTSVPVRLRLPPPGYFWRISAGPSSLRAGDILALAHPFVSEQ